MLFAGTDKKSLMPRPMLLAKPRGLPMTPAEPNNFKFRKQWKVVLYRYETGLLNAIH